MKRAIDLVAAVVGLLLLWPVFLVVAVLVKAEDGGPVLFKQERIGRLGRPFRILKFRTMTVDAPSRGPAITTQGDARITRVGAFLRRAKLDELPQLWNVLCGEMSLVGARPEVPRYVELFRSEYNDILKLRPGITDPASIRFRDESELLGASTDPEATYIERILPEKLRLARDYARHASPAYDLQLVLTTLMCLVYPARAMERLADFLMPWRMALGIIVQIGAVAAAFALATLVRFDGQVPAADARLFVQVLPVVLVARVVWLHALKLFHGVWRYSGVHDLRNIVTAATLGTVTWWAAAHWLMGAEHLSRGVVAIDWLLTIVLLAGIRIARRFHREMRPGVVPTHRVLLVGEEDRMARVASELLSRPARDCEVVGMLNGDIRRKGVLIHGVPILGTKQDLTDVIRATDPDEILFAMSETADGAKKALLQQCRVLGKTARSAPDPGDMLLRQEKPQLGGSYRPEDLLFREAITTDGSAARSVVTGHCVVITGAGGSIGSEICRQVAACEPSCLVLFERHEFALYEIERELRRKFPTVNLVPVIGDVADEKRVDAVFGTFKPHAVFHAAAYKHVPMMERNPVEALRTNVAGTRTAAEAAVRHGADVFLLISTDKAVEPVCMMGMSKRLAELTLQLMKEGSRTRILTVRFGNVLESSGSVLPLFREQIERGGPVTVTHAEVTRLFMTVPEAVQLILHAASMGRGGEVFVLDMGRPIRIVDLAKALIRMYGLTPGKDIEIAITGLRPGERLFEKLLNDHETVWKSSHPKILRAVSHFSESDVRDEMKRLLQASHERIGGEHDVLRAASEPQLA